ncbi:MAG: circularly permuted type 2 ATP-grasp protein [Thermoleophilaceae bacterium]|nr:circularly permuted type 2 ATP-grasp protein [Thermoleophilaceae bacterium]
MAIARFPPTDLAEVPGYVPTAGIIDECSHCDPAVEALYCDFFESLGGVDFGTFGAGVQAAIDARGVDFGHERFRVDPIPRIIGAEEWRSLEAGLTQRVRALNAFIADIYGERAIVAAGVVPERVLAGADHFEPELSGAPLVGVAHAPIAGLDVVRGADGVLRVLEDNLRTPSGLGYAAAVRTAIDGQLPGYPPSDRAESDVAVELIRDALEAARGELEGKTVLLSDGPVNSAWYEHRWLARRLGIRILTTADLYRRGDRVRGWVGGRSVEISVIYRRTDEDSLVDSSGQSTAIGRLTLTARRAGMLSFVNDFGAGVADDKLVHGYVKEMIRFYLGEEPLVPSVETFDLGRPEVLEQVIDRIDELVVKPRNGQGGAGIVVCAHARREDVDLCIAAIRAHPERYVAQPMVAISTHPTVVGGRLVPRHVDLRAFVVCGTRGTSAVPGGLTRVAFGSGALVVNSSQAGGGKDTWVMRT